MFSAQDVSIVIPTYNREKDLRITLTKGIPFIKRVREVLIIDQSTNNETRKLILSLKNNKIRYYYRKIPSLTKARNFGIGKVSKSSKIVLFLDDDVTLDKYYLLGILNVFNEQPRALGVSGFQKNKGRGNFESFLRKLFLLENSEKDYAGVRSVYGAVYPSILTKTINAEWLAGYNMAYKKEVFKNFQFDENLSKYALAEDLDFSYRINKRYSNSLFITPDSSVIHRFSSVERTPTERAFYMNQLNHFYLNFKNFNSNCGEKVAFIWSLKGITLLRIIELLIKRNRHAFLKLKFYFKSILFCLKNLEKIKRGNLIKLMEEID